MAEEEPRNVKELLVEAKDASELMVDLAYAAVFFDEEDLAEDAEAIESVIWIAGAIETIGDAASDIARVVQAKLGIPNVLRPDLRHANEISGRVKVRENAPAIGQTLRELSMPTETGMWLMAIRRGMEWEFDPGPDSVVSEGDVLFFQGPEDGTNLIRELAGARRMPA